MDAELERRLRNAVFALSVAIAAPPDEFDLGGLPDRLADVQDAMEAIEDFRSRRRWREEATVKSGLVERLRHAAVALSDEAHAHEDELDVAELRLRLADVSDVLEALDGGPLRDSRAGRDGVAAALNAAGLALEVCEYVGRFKRLEDLALRVWREALEAGVEAAKRSDR